MEQYPRSQVKRQSRSTLSESTGKGGQIMVTTQPTSTNRDMTSYNEGHITQSGDSGQLTYLRRKEMLAVSFKGLLLL